MVDPTGSDTPHQPTAGQHGSDAGQRSAGDAQALENALTGRVDTTLTFSLDMAAGLTPEAGVSGEESEAISALPSGSALLVVRRGPNIGARFLLDSDVTTAGRHPDAEIFLDDVTVSRKHAQFLRNGTSFTVKDNGSLNGTYFDGVRIDEALLADGAEVQVGKFRLTFYASRVDLARLATA